MPALTANQRRVLSIAQLQAASPLPEIARQAGLKVHSTRSAIEGLQERKILFPYAYLNIHALGYLPFEIYFALPSASSKSHAALRRALLQSGSVAWLAEFGGDFQYGISLYVRSVMELDAFLTSITSKFGLMFSHKSVALNYSWISFRCKYLYQGDAAINSVASLPDVTPQIIDELDHNILSGLSELRHRSHSDLARSIGVPATTVDYRIKQLEARGIIRGYVYRVDSAALGVYV